MMDPFTLGILIGAALMLLPVAVLYSFARYQRRIIRLHRDQYERMWPAYCVGRARRAALAKAKAKKAGAAS